MHTYTDSEKKFIETYAWGHSYKEITDEFNERFNTNIRVSQIGDYLQNHKIMTGRTGRFEKGHIPANKGTHAGGWKPTQFKKGHVPSNHQPVGTESVRRNYKKNQEYVYVKVAEPNKWKMKHIVTWEKHNGPIPKGKVIIFLDGNSLNTDIANLMLIDRAIHVIMNHMGLRQDNPEGTEAAIRVAKLISCVSKASKRAKRNGTRETVKINI